MATAIAVDLGASSGRHLVGRFDGRQLSLTECHRFENGPIRAAGTLFWDVLRQWQDIVNGLRACRQAIGNDSCSVGVDTWGVDFALLGRGDTLLGNPVNYRDARTDGALEAAFAVAPRELIFAETGIQFMQINTVYQLHALRRQNSPWLEAAESFLMMPDFFHWLLSGEKANEFSNATTTQLFNPVTRRWSSALIERLQLPPQLWKDVIEPGTKLGRLRGEVATDTGLNNVQVIVPGTHDTASAVLAVPAQGPARPNPDWCYISSGTWSLMGVELPAPVINEQSLALNFTNEGGVGRTTRLLKNIAGLWLVQECRRIWRAAGQDYTWSELTAAASEAPPLRSLIEPDAAEFLAPLDMPAAIADYCRRTGQPVPETPGQFIRCALESLALKYRRVHGWLRELTTGSLATIHVVGGGANNQLLCQLTADATGCRVVAGPVEATAIGNVAMQFISQGEWSNVNEARQVVRTSFPTVEYHPRSGADWSAAAERFARL